MTNGSRIANIQPSVAAGPDGAVAVAFYDRRAACPADPSVLFCGLDEAEVGLLDREGGEPDVVALQELDVGRDRRLHVTSRYGGEEFLVLLPETDLEGAISLAEKIRHAAHSRSFGDGERVFPLTLSAGAATLWDNESGNDMIARADMALYQAKEQGRNRVEAAR